MEESEDLLGVCWPTLDPTLLLADAEPTGVCADAVVDRFRGVESTCDCEELSRGFAEHSASFDLLLWGRDLGVLNKLLSVSCMRWLLVLLESRECEGLFEATLKLCSISSGSEINAASRSLSNSSSSSQFSAGLTD